MAERVNRSVRGFPLVWQGVNPDQPVLTVECYCKWYGFYLVHPDGRVEAVPFPEGGWCDHVPNPRAFVEEARRLDAIVDENALDMIVGRWAREVRDDDWLRDLVRDLEA